MTRLALRGIGTLWISLMLLLMRGLRAVAAVVVGLVLGRVLTLRRVALRCTAVRCLIVAWLLTIWSLVLWRVASRLLGIVVALLWWWVALSLGRSSAVGLLVWWVAAASVVLVAGHFVVEGIGLLREMKRSG